MKKSEILFNSFCSNKEIASALLLGKFSSPMEELRRHIIVLQDDLEELKNYLIKFIELKDKMKKFQKLRLWKRSSNIMIKPRSCWLLRPINQTKNS